MKERNFLWSEEQLDKMVELEKYKKIGIWIKLGLNVYEIESLNKEGKKSSFEEACINLFRIKAIVSNEIYKGLEKLDPVVWVRIRDIENKVERKELKKFRDYLKLLEDRSFEFPDLHWWPYNFESPEKFHQYVKQKLETGNYIAANKFSSMP